MVIREGGGGELFSAGFTLIPLDGLTIFPLIFTFLDKHCRFVLFVIQTGWVLAFRQDIHTSIIAKSPDLRLSQGREIFNNGFIEFSR